MRIDREKGSDHLLLAGIPLTKTADAEGRPRTRKTSAPPGIGKKGHGQVRPRAVLPTEAGTKQRKASPKICI